ncbi:Diphthamide biosynthesis protein 4 [Ptychographa xylographoides]|nr:Diphthamide biosynthesis protein 4 [Ptychographa xylographoides]
MNYYEVLSLPFSYSSVASVGRQDIKTAYRRALLQHHPDKSIAQDFSSLSRPRYTVDEIMTAYKVLSDPSRRRELDRRLRLQASLSAQSGDKASSLSGLDTVDLDDLEFDSVDEIWYRRCRCGNQRGYLVTEADLEKEVEHGELITGCGGCSLWLKVVFQSVDEG